ncbi:MULTISPECIES: signal peptidase I [Streptomyces]|uniref:signal peptidase I n=1 Tax=Streptomyces griseoaurantiacus TaxID=68213 RepID=UPI0032446BA8
MGGGTGTDDGTGDGTGTNTDDGVYVGSAGKDAALDRGWLLGHFREPGDPRHSDAVEVKWGIHPRGERRARWVQGEVRTAVLVLISGRFRMEFPGRHVLLEEQGDYVVWRRGVDHSWEAEEDSVVLTVRWPSVPGYAVPPEVPEAPRTP